jgi:hypothetical protein
VVAEVLREFGLDQEQLTARVSSEARKAFAWVCRNEAGLPLAEIAPVLGVTVWAVSRLESGGERLRSEDARFRKRLEAVVSRLARPIADDATGPRSRLARKSQNKT